MAINQARFAMDVLREDLEQAQIFPTRPGISFAASLVDADATHGWAPGSGKPPVVDLASDDITQCRFGRGGTWLRLLARGITKIDDDGDPATIDLVDLAAPAAISYQIVRRHQAGSSPRYFLFRSVVDPQATFAAGYDFTSAAYNTPNDSALGLPGNIVRPHIDQVFASDVIDFGVRLFGDASAEPLFPDSTTAEYLVGSTGDPAPASAEVYLRVLTTSGVDLIAAIESGRSTADWWETALANSQTYSMRVRLVRPL